MELSRAVNQHRDRVFSVVHGQQELPDINSIIRQSWFRCVQEYGLDPSGADQPHIVESDALAEKLEAHRHLLSIAKLEMTSLRQQIAGSGHSILLTDNTGLVLSYVGDPAFNQEATRRGLVEGAVWAERYQGTNGIGTCLAEQVPLIVHHEQHFLSQNLSLTCTAAPIFDPSNNLVAVLDASSEATNAQQHTMALVTMSAKMIENRIFLCMFKNHFVLRFHSRPEFVNILGEGLIAFQSDATILAANGSALFQLDFTSSDELRGRKIDELFDKPLSLLLDHSAQTSLHAIPILELKHSRRFYAIIQTPQPQTRIARSSTKRPARTCEGKASVGSTPGILETLEFGDYQMAQNIRVVRRVFDRDIPIIISGESGTGKGVFAKAVHLSSDRAHKPYVAINCSSIPESLIESELFGYKAGAFTGASRNGSTGKIVQADGGTLFLDEIGDMPLTLQARLLRVLEEKEVIPLGSNTPITVDLRVISATHRNLEQMVRDGTFREDLYYRLQGVKVTLPPLRDRADRGHLVQHLINVESAYEDAVVEVDDAVLERLLSYHWPGNIRQMRNVVRTMIALNESGRITAQDMSQGFFRDLHRLADPPEDTPVGSDEDSAELHNPLRSAEREALLEELEKHRWNVSKAAKSLALSRNTLYRKMKRCHIAPPR